MKKFIILIFYFLTFTSASSQNILVIEKVITLAVNTQDTIMWSMADFFSADNSQPYYNPPDYASFTGDYRMTLQKTSGNAADSLVMLNKPGDHQGNFLYSRVAADLDSIWVWGSNFTTSYQNIGGGNVYEKGLTSVHYPLVTLFSIVKQGDLTGGSRTYKICLTKDK